MVAKREQAVDEAVVRAWLQSFVDQGVISRWGVPDQVLLAGAIPKTSMGKLDKKAMREQYADMIQVR